MTAKSDPQRKKIRAALAMLPCTPKITSRDLDRASDALVNAGQYHANSRNGFPSRNRTNRDLANLSTRVDHARDALNGDRPDRRVPAALRSIGRLASRLDASTREEVHAALLAQGLQPSSLLEQLANLESAVAAAKNIVAKRGHLRARPATREEHVAQTTADLFEGLTGRRAAITTDPISNCLKGEYLRLLGDVFRALGIAASAGYAGAKIVEARIRAVRMVENAKNDPPFTSAQT